MSPESFQNAWDVKEKDLRVVNFKQGDIVMEFWTEESIEDIYEQVKQQN